VRVARPAEAIAAALFEGDDASRARLQAELAEAQEAIVPVITRGAATGRYPLYRLAAERVLSVNTTAAGGNTTLMTLG
jgi:RHH-type proline utilization regulon transcriptional repressor/proline dehydrogenase/delta 1-pyrroline-5-carboxylate dehydrogenase